jgi:hypothetical protein
MKMWLDVQNLTIPGGEIANEYRVREEIQRELAALMAVRASGEKGTERLSLESRYAGIARSIFEAVLRAQGK